MAADAFWQTTMKAPCYESTSARTFWPFPEETQIAAGSQESSSRDVKRAQPALPVGLVTANIELFEN